MNQVIQLLKDPSVEPTEIALSLTLKELYPKYVEFTARQKTSGIVLEWRYYNDGKAWLCKNTYKKKTVFWLSVWEGYFKLSFYFTAAIASGLNDLNVPDAFKQTLPAVGKLIPLIINIDQETDLNAVFKVIEYKRGT